MIVYPTRDIPQFVMYCVNGKPRSSLFIESTDSMIYIYICLSRFCACAAHAQDNNNNNYLYLQWVAMVFLVYFPRRFGMQLPLVAKGLREASALMSISSILYITRKRYSVGARLSGRTQL